eukprot:gnl/TRDRNA2_/TRDRNA2_135015_c0_seq1.p1 gnl/TRDRNA2_/TRDRNA2_135015_c0~~gnl/TRDRNA2_/TRDRNA2_135015_c0_seq1.p1  ORF type:complete len:208 (+),score=25.33 gnl/TRDRNA2_/TRDRNA2_135015_c0_seq1:383-1006(+)
MPQLISNFRGIYVVLKPRGWEVDGKASTANDCELLSCFVQKIFPQDRHPLVHASDFDHGFIHRLDIPSSGLILAGTTFEGFYWIRWQLNVYHIERDYFVVCQGSIPSELKVIDLPIDVRTHKQGSHRSLTCEEHGGPAKTWLCSTAHLWAPPTVDPGAPASQSVMTSTVIRIRTGRKHQIRTHVRSSGHPSVADGMYSVFECYHGPV